MKHKLKDKSGQGLSEYMILVMLIAVGSIAAARTVGGTIRSKLDRINKSLKSVNTPRARGTPEPDPNEDTEGTDLWGQIFGRGH